MLSLGELPNRRGKHSSFVTKAATDYLQGFNVPEPLRKYLPGAPEFIPFSKELPKDSTSLKAKGKAGDAPKPKVAPVGAAPKDAAEKLKDLKV